jgi:hypothetical protein
VLQKIDIVRAFDTVVWPFVLDILRHLGFPSYWSNWIFGLLMSVSTKLLLNGSPGQHICHARGLRRGDLLSPLLFVLVMVVLDALFRKADKWGLFHPLDWRPLLHRACLYANDLVLLICLR